MILKLRPSALREAPFTFSVKLCVHSAELCVELLALFEAARCSRRANTWSGRPRHHVGAMTQPPCETIAQALPGRSTSRSVTNEMQRTAQTMPMRNHRLS